MLKKTYTAVKKSGLYTRENFASFALHTYIYMKNNNFEPSNGWGTMTGQLQW